MGVSLNFAAAVALAGAAASPEPVVFGQQMGAEIGFPECKFKTSEYVPGHLYAGGDAAPCFMVSDGTSSIHFPTSMRPEILAMDDIYLVVIAGKVEGFKTATLGHNRSAEVIAKLSAKFGPPTSVSHPRIVASGIAINEVRATWVRPNLSVLYESIVDDLDSGSLKVFSDKALASEVKALDADDKKRAAL